MQLKFRSILFLFLFVSSATAYRKKEEAVLFPTFLNCLEYTQAGVCFCCENFFGKCKSNSVHKFRCLCDKIGVPVYEQRNYKQTRKDD